MSTLLQRLKDREEKEVQKIDKFLEELAKEIDDNYFIHFSAVNDSVEDIVARHRMKYARELVHKLLKMKGEPTEIYKLTPVILPPVCAPPIIKRQGE